MLQTIRNFATAAAIVVLIPSAIPVDAGTASNGVPEISIGFNSESFSSTSFLDSVLPLPIVRYSRSGKIADFDVEGGFMLEVNAAKTVNDLKQTPYSLWGKFKRSFGPGSLTARVEADSSNLNQLRMDVLASNGPTSIRLIGTANAEAKSVDVRKVKLSQDIPTLEGILTVMPTYDLKTQKGDVSVAYTILDTVVTVEMAGKTQRLIVSRMIGPNSKFTPSITTDGEIELEYQRAIRTGSLTASYKPNASFKLRWNDGPWIASMDAPINGYYNFNEGAKFGVRRQVL